MIRRASSGISAASISLVLLCLLAACSSQPVTTKGVFQVPTAVPSPVLTTTLPLPRYGVQTRPNLAYGPLPEELLDLCLPVGASGSRPGVLLIHGGGWTNGDKGEFAQQCNYLASLGFVAATINYRLAPAHIWPAQLVDTQLALRFLRANASTYALDSTRLCSWGSSSGSHLAVFLGVLATIYAGDEAQRDANQSVSVSCVVDEFGPVNLETYQETQSQRDLLHLLFGGATLQGNPALYHEASPYFDVSPQSAPTLIIQGTQDTVVPPDQSQALQKALQQAQVPAPFISYTGAHGFAGLSGEQIQQIEAEEVSFLIGYEHP